MLGLESGVAEIAPGRPAFTDSAAPGSTCFLSELLVDILDGLPDSGPQLIETGGEPTVRGRFMAEVRRHSLPAPWN
jgi:hypothetical protein